MLKANFFVFCLFVCLLWLGWGAGSRSHSAGRGEVEVEECGVKAEKSNVEFTR